MKKRWYIIVTLLVIVFSLVACSTNSSEPNEEIAEETKEEVQEAVSEEESVEEPKEEQVFNAETLAAFNGKYGQPAYVAVDGVVYDVTDVKAWQSPHAGKFEPGKDYSDEIGKSPHGTIKLNGLSKVGVYEE